MPEMQPLDETAFDELSETAPEHPAPEAATNATIDLGSTGIDELHLSDDFELEHAAEPAQDVAAWDDSHHMDKLLAEIKDQPPADEFEPAFAIADDEPVHEEVAPAPAEAAEWMPDESLAIKPTTASRGRSKSVVRTLVMPAVCGLIGLAAGYYALLWIKGPQIDFLDAAKYLPKVMLPASFSSTTAHAPNRSLSRRCQRRQTTPLLTKSPTNRLQRRTMRQKLPKRRSLLTLPPKSRPVSQSQLKRQARMTTGTAQQRPQPIRPLSQQPSTHPLLPLSAPTSQTSQLKRCASLALRPSLHPISPLLSSPRKTPSPAS